MARTGLQAALAALAGFLALAAAVAAGSTAQLDRMTLEAFDALRGPGLDGFFRAATWLGSGYVLAPATIAAMAALAARRQWSAARLAGLAYFGASISTWLLKQVIGRERPAIFPALAEIAPGDWSFPSGHATHAAAAALGLGLLAWRHGVRWRGPAMALLAGAALVVALSRLYLQVHWPSDLLAGVLVAGFWAGLATAVSPQGASGRPA